MIKLMKIKCSKFIVFRKINSKKIWISSIVSKIKK